MVLFWGVWNLKRHSFQISMLSKFQKGARVDDISPALPERP